MKPPFSNGSKDHAKHHRNDRESILLKKITQNSKNQADDDIREAVVESKRTHHAEDQNSWNQELIFGG